MGSALAFASALSFATMYFFVRAGVRPGDPDGGTFVTTLVNSLILGSIIVIVAVLTGPPTLEAGGLFWFAMSGFLGTFAARTMLYAGVHRIGPVRASAVTNTAPIITVALAVLVIGERLSPNAILATALLSTGLLLLVHEAYRTDRAAAQAADDPVRADPLAMAIEVTAVDAMGALVRTQRAVHRIRSKLGTPAMIGVSFAAASALGFGLSRSVRKLGIDLLPDPVLGAAVGAWVALSLNIIVQAARGRLGLLVRRTVVDFRPHLWMAGVMSTLGMLTFYMAIDVAPLSHVAVITASETAITLVLGALLFRQAERLSPRVTIPALCVFAGGVLVALG